MRKSLDTLGIPQEQLLQEQMALFAKVRPSLLTFPLRARFVVWLSLRCFLNLIVSSLLTCSFARRPAMR